tara:strand:- start:3369 stop:4250 length:882 start_codon:yes stop_codon:yes gene_type:complete
MLTIARGDLSKVDSSLVIKVEVSRSIIGILSILIEHKTIIVRDTPAVMFGSLKEQLSVLLGDECIGATTDYISSQMREFNDSILLVYKALIGYKSDGERYAMGRYNAPDADIEMPQMLMLSVSSMIANYLRDNFESIFEVTVKQTPDECESLLRNKSDEPASVSLSRVIYVLMYSRLGRLYNGREPVHLTEVYKSDDGMVDRFNSFLVGESDRSVSDMGVISCAFDDGAVMVIKPAVRIKSDCVCRSLNATFYTDDSLSVIVCSYSIDKCLEGEYSAEYKLTDQDRHYKVIIE